MYVSTNRFWLRISVSMRSLLWLSLGMALVMSSRMAVGQEVQAPAQAPAQTQFGDTVEDGWLFSDQLTGQSGEAFGAKLRAGVLTGPAIGREASIVPVELMPYAFAGKGMIFGDVRGFRGTSDLWGANLGGGYRYHSERFDRIFGANAYYDYDNTSGALFRQWGFGLETLGALWDLRANAYFPTGATEQLLSVNFVPGSERFVGHQILFDQRRIIGNALTGVDMEVATPLPGRVMQRHDVRVAGGWYHYQGQELEGFTGWKTRIQGNLLPSIQLQLEVTHDRIFNTNVVFGAAWTYGGYRQPETERRTQFSRMTEPVRRNYNMIVAKTSILDPDKVAINPHTGNPYFVEHVASYALIPGANGTVLHPWQTVNQAQTDPAFAPSIAAAGGDIIFVHADSVYTAATFPTDNSVTLTPSIRILGEGNGVDHRINIANLGQIPLPRATAFVNRPIFSGSPANGVTLLSGSTAVPSEFSGFQIGGPPVNPILNVPDPLLPGPVGNGIFGNGVSNVLITQTDVNFAGGDGVLLQDLSGPVTFRGTLVNDPTGTAFHVLRGTGGVTFTDDPVSGAQGRIVNSGGLALWVENTLPGSFVDLTGATITDTLGRGILIDNANGTTTVDDSTITNGLVTGIEVRGGGGNTNFRGAVNISNPLGDAISIHDTLVASTVTFSQTTTGVAITNRNAHGINLLANAGLVKFAGPVSITDTIGSAAAAVEYQDSSGDAQFLSLNITGGGGEGILIGGGGAPLLSNTGQFRVAGNATISNVTNNGILITNDDAQVTFNGLNILSRGLSGINIHDSRGSVIFNGISSIDNGNNSTSPAVDIQNNTTAGVSFQTLTITGATRPLPLIGGAGLNVINNPASVAVQTLNVTAVDGIALFADTAGVSVINSLATAQLTGILSTGTGGLFVGGGTIDASGTNIASGREAINVHDSVIGVTLTSVSSTNSAGDGIRLVNNIGTGTTTAAGVAGGTSDFNKILFRIAGVSNATGSGGTITGAALDGGHFVNTGGVSLTGVNFIGNGGAGVNAQTAELDLNVVQSQSNGTFGIDVLDTPFFNMFSSILNGNGQNEFRFTAATKPPVVTTNGVYTVVMGDGITTNGNQILDANADAVLIRAVGGGIGSTLKLSYVNNTTNVTAAGLHALNLNWNGPVTAAIDLNTFNFGTTGSTGVLINLGSPTAASNVEILSNTFNAPAGIGTTGIDLTTNGGPANITVGSLLGQATGNVMTFTSPGFLTGDIGMRFSLGSNTNIDVSNNVISMVADGATAIEYTSVQGTSTITMNNNVISVTDAPDLFGSEYGIRILSVTGTVTLFGSVNNDILLDLNQRRSVSPWFSAPATINGKIIVNGVPVP